MAFLPATAVAAIVGTALNKTASGKRFNERFGLGHVASWVREAALSAFLGPELHGTSAAVVRGSKGAFQAAARRLDDFRIRLEGERRPDAARALGQLNGLRQAIASVLLTDAKGNTVCLIRAPGENAYRTVSDKEREAFERQARQDGVPLVKVSFDEAKLSVVTEHAGRVTSLVDGQGHALPAVLALSVTDHRDVARLREALATGKPFASAGLLVDRYAFYRDGLEVNPLEQARDRALPSSAAPLRARPARS